MKKILFVSSEAHPLIKTGGLADVSGSLPKALAELSQDVRLILPNYQGIKSDKEVRFLCSLRVDNRDVNLLETQLPDSEITVWLVDYPEFYHRPGNPYLDGLGNSWPDNADRFALFCRIAVEVAMNRANLDWQPDIVHCNDWQSGLVPALLSLEVDSPASVFTIHNLAYQGLFPAESIQGLSLPGQLWHPEGLEFYHMLSFIKGGLVYADHITTVSPTYALEIQTSAYGCGLEGLLLHRKDVLRGILNGIDLEVWSPETDPLIPQHYRIASLADKQYNKSEIQRKFALPVNDHVPLFGLIGRLVEQKGIDLIIDCLPDMLSMPMQLVLLGSGDKVYEQRLQNLAHVYPDKMAITLGYDEPLAHLIEAGSDVFLMPSRFEPCGLNQMYSQRYGTLPIVRKTGGLADTVVDTLPETIADRTATGFVFNEASASSLLEAIKRAMILYSDKKAWATIQTNAMKKDFSWRHSAEQYLMLYRNL
ncbi:glycogen synthase 1 [Methyloglobulus morosus KoM1]|uniref:Glycogen synthase n=1 Tax=Methyloglobulus morosus KoM1 TaxID=1116472 RepID=V5BH12_9GAMM|nr:glycogen synthase GlgA [Methyloglobulus morosus]ESS72585.1 glycogen synthase 1 [Methyloglobulus morosus KoM1]